MRGEGRATTGVAHRHQVEVRIAASPEHIWDLLADVGNMGRWSPICRRCEWIDGATGPAPGARFKGHNRLWGWRWSRECVVDEAARGRSFAFHTLLRGRESVRWRYELDPDGSGTEVRESYEIIREPGYLRLMPHVARAFRRASERGMSQTLDRLKAAAESSGGHEGSR